jgi:preprotein translocase subunit SecF
MVDFEVPEIDYSEYTNRQLLVVPLSVLAVAVVVLLGWSLFVTGTPASPGSPVGLGIDFTGGSELTVVTSTPREEIAGAFDPAPVSVQPVASEGVGGEANQFILTFQPLAPGEVPEGTSDIEVLVQQAEQNLDPVSGNDEVVKLRQSTSPAFGAGAQQTALLGLVVAFVGMSLLAFVLFRTFVPSIAIIASAASDILIPLAAMNVLGIKLSLGTVAALLMLIGYSVDSDILLNDHIIRRGGDFYEATYRAMRTGVTMTLTSISAMAVMALVAFYFGIDLLSAIGLVLVLGLTTDLMNTYLMNLSLLRWYKFSGVARRR